MLFYKLGLATDHRQQNLLPGLLTNENGETLRIIVISGRVILHPEESLWRYRPDWEGHGEGWGGGGRGRRGYISRHGT